MYLFLTQCFASRIGGIENLMTNFSLTLALKSEVKVFADQNFIAQDEFFDLQNEKFLKVFRYGGVKIFRRHRKARDVKLFIKNNKIDAIISDTWKSLELCIDEINSDQIPTICLAHGNELICKNNKRKERITKIFNKIGKIVANSRYTAQLLKNLGIKDQNIHIVNPGAKSLDNVKASNQYKLNGNPILLTLSRLDKRKGHKNVLDAIKRLTSDFPRIQYIIAGEGPEKKNLLKYRKALKLLDKVVFIGNINDEQKKEIFQHSTLMIMPTTDEISTRSIEGFGITYIEAAMSGLCSVATDVGGVGDAIIDNSTGILLKPNEDLFLCLKNLLEDKRKLNDLGREAKERALKDFNWETVVEKYLKIIKN